MYIRIISFVLVRLSFGGRHWRWADMCVTLDVWWHLLKAGRPCPQYCPLYLGWMPTLARLCCRDCIICKNMKYILLWWHWLEAVSGGQPVLNWLWLRELIAIKSITFLKMRERHNKLSPTGSTLSLNFKQIMYIRFGAIQVLRNAIFLEIGPPPTPRNANNIENYTFVTLFPENQTPPPRHPHLRYITLEWPLLPSNSNSLLLPVLARKISDLCTALWSLIEIALWCWCYMLIGQQWDHWPNYNISTLAI